MTAEQRAYYSSRKPFTPAPGNLYTNEGGGVFLCKRSGWHESGWHESGWPENCAEMQNVKSGWTFEAHGCGVYHDGQIDWDYSKNGRFEEV